MFKHSVTKSYFLPLDLGLPLYVIQEGKKSPFQENTIFKRPDCAMILALPESFQITGIMLPFIYLSLIEEEGNTEVAVQEHVRGVFTVCGSEIKQDS